MPKFVRQGDNTLTGNNTFTGTNTFSGAIVASGGITGDVVGNAVTVTVADTTDTTSSVALFESATGDLAPKTDAGLTYNAGTGMLTATGLTGPLTGDSAGTHTGAVAATTLSASGLTKTPNRVSQNTITDVDAQNATPTIAQILGGIIVHTSVTGAGTATVPTGTAMSGGISGVAVGSTIHWLYYNDGDQTVTITANTDHTLVGGTAAVTTGKHMEIISVCTATNTWVSFLTTLM